MMMKRIVVICFLISLIIPIDAQTNLWIQLYDRNTGGLNETVYALKQDDRGLIWITTYGGLYSYDGQRFVHHPDSTVKPPMAGYHWRPNTAFENKLAELAQKEHWLRNGKERILCSMEDRDGNLWMGFTNGLRLCRKQEHPFHISDFDEEVLCLFQSSNGEIWMTTREGSVCLLDRWLKPFQLAYFMIDVRVCNHCAKIAVSTIPPIAGSVSVSGEKRAQRSEGLVRYILNDVMCCIVFALASTL